MAMEKSFVDIVQEMLESGYSSGEIAKTLELLGLGKADAQRLVEVLGEKAVLNVGERLSGLVEKKIISMKEARKIEQKRWVKNRKKRFEDSVWQARAGVQRVLRDVAPSQIAVFNSRLSGFESALHDLERAKIEIRAFLAEVEGKKLKGSQRRIVKNALELFKP